MFFLLVNQIPEDQVICFCSTSGKNDFIGIASNGFSHLSSRGFYERFSFLTGCMYAGRISEMEFTNFTHEFFYFWVQRCRGAMVKVVHYLLEFICRNYEKIENLHVVANSSVFNSILEILIERRLPFLQKIDGDILIIIIAYQIPFKCITFNSQKCYRTAGILIKW